MKKYRFVTYLKSIAIINIVLLVCYLGLFALLNFAFEGELTQLSGALNSVGYSADDLSRQKVILIKALMIFVDLIIFIGFYALSYWRLQINADEKKQFLSYIGAEHLENNDLKNFYFSSRGKTQIKYFFIIISICSAIELIGIPFATLLLLPQTMLFGSILTLLSVTGVLRKVLLFLLTVFINIIVYYIYQRYICANIYIKWSKERLRVDRNT